ncbi:glycosyl hydrolase family 61-domain-containing protein [Daedaleopsis nitida]|nr:glycosyl hydrolase family 61-domain-containing protein [Daedaleopsis nitida]
MPLLLPLFFLSYYAVSIVNAHGFVSSVTMNGKEFKGRPPTAQFGNSQFDSPIRQISTFEPQYKATNPAVNCGPNSKKVALVVDADPGSKVSFLWVANNNVKDSKANVRDSFLCDVSLMLIFYGSYATSGHIGPLVTYMASCGKTSCKDFDSTNAEWFKIDQVGKKANSNDWVQKDLMSRKPYTLTLPKNIAPGEYLIRHEIIALHLADQAPGMAEFYVSCTQVRMTGNGDGTPSADELVKFPGGYHDKDKGLFSNTFFDAGATYNFPGPKIAQFVVDGKSGKTSSGNSTSSAHTSSAASSVVSSATPTRTSASPAEATGSSDSAKCRVKNGKTAKRHHRRTNH